MSWRSFITARFGIIGAVVEFGGAKKRGLAASVGAGVALAWARMKRTVGIFIFLCVIASGLAGAPTNRVLFVENFARGLTNKNWQNLAFFKPPTAYTLVRDGTNFCLHGVAERTCSAMSVKLDLPAPKQLKLRWRWRIEGVNPNASERDLKKFDHAARVFIAFDTFVGPPRTLNYMWGNVEKVGAVLPHPKSSRAQIFVLQSGNARTNEWVTEARDVTADWKKVFGDRVMPRIVGLGAMTDNDSLGQRLVGDYADFELWQE
ncbi:MAG: hypothetical protein RL380_117 [Verrucomicrobiota bacterium]|jgi:hypothetical protein